MMRYLLKRIALMIPTLLGILTLTFVVIQFVPGGPVEQAMLDIKSRVGQSGEASGGSVTSTSVNYRGRQGLDAERIKELQAYYGFDQPVLTRFGLMLKNYARFDLGTSFFQHKKVSQLILEKLPVSITLGLWTFFLSYLISVPLGIAKAVRAGSRFDVITSALVLIGYAIPGFVLGVTLLVLFGGGSFLQWFPLRGLTSDNFASLSTMGKITDYLWHIVLPISASVLGSFAVITLLTKNTLLEEMGKHYVLTARAKGLSERGVLWKHIFRNAMIPLVTGFPAAFIGAFFTGSLLIETLFSLDGLGLLSYEAVLRRDYPIVLGTLFVFTLIGLVVKLISDVCYVWVDPRVQFSART